MGRRRYEYTSEVIARKVQPCDRSTNIRTSRAVVQTEASRGTQTFRHGDDIKVKDPRTQEWLLGTFIKHRSGLWPYAEVEVCGVVRMVVMERIERAG